MGITPETPGVGRTTLYGKEVIYKPGVEGKVSLQDDRGGGRSQESARAGGQEDGIQRDGLNRVRLLTPAGRRPTQRRMGGRVLLRTS